MWEARVSLCRRWFVIIIVQSLSHVWLFVTSWTIACQVPQSSTISWSLLKFMSIESVMLSKQLIQLSPLLLLPSIFPSIKVFSNELALCIRWPKYGASSSATVLPMKSQGWFPIRLTGLIFLLSKGLSRVFCTPQFKGIYSLALCLLYGRTLTIARDHWEDHQFSSFQFSSVAQSCPTLCRQSNISAFPHRV